MSRRMVYIDSLVVKGHAIPGLRGAELARAVEAKLALLLTGRRGFAPMDGAVGALSANRIGKTVAQSVFAAVKGKGTNGF